MSIIGDLVGGLFGGGADDAQDAARDAAGIQAQSSQAGIDELRRQFDRSEARLTPFANFGLSGINQIATTPGGIDRNLNQILGSRAFQGLRDERQRAADAAFATGGLTRSGRAGQAAADLSTSLGLGLENDVFNRAFGQIQLGQNSAAGLGSLGANNSSSLANLFGQQGSAQAGGIIQGQQAQAQAGQNSLNTALGIGSIAANAGAFSGPGSLLFGSDPRLKKNAERVSWIGVMPLYQWDWIDALKGTVIEAMPTLGFMSTDVRRHFPQHVHVVEGFDFVDYGALLEEL